MGRMSTERLDIYKKNLFNNYRNMQERINLAISVEELKSLFEQSKGLSKEPSSLERIQFAIDTQTLKALIKPKGISNVRPLPPIERINFSISKKELESLVFLSYKKSEQKKKKEEQVKKQLSQIQAQPQENNFPSGNIILTRIAKIVWIYIVLSAAGIIFSEDIALLLRYVYLSIGKVLQNYTTDIMLFLIASFLITITVYHILRLTNALYLKKQIGIINGIVLHLMVIVPAVYLQSTFFQNKEYIEKISTSAGRLELGGEFIVGSVFIMLCVILIHLFLIIILHLFGNKEYRIPNLI
jgi:hypothetical protein